MLCLMELWFDCVSFLVYSEHAMIKYKDQRVWVCLEHARFQNAEEVRRRWPDRWGNIPAPTKRTYASLYRKMAKDRHDETG